MLRDQLLRPAAIPQLGQHLFPVHRTASKHRNADILTNGIPISNGGTVPVMATRERTPFGNRLREARLAAGLTQDEVKAALKISQGTLAELEKIASGSAHTSALAKLYGVDAHWLATGEGAARPSVESPFSPELRAAIGRLNANGLRKLENVMRAHLDMQPLQTAGLEAA